MTELPHGARDAVGAGAGAVPDDGPRTAGAILRAAREREGMHLEVLAATIKVSPAKLEALENDRIAELPNPTFARALAQSVCRSLKIDPRPVLALLPQVEAPPLEDAVGKLNEPFRERFTGTDGGGLAWASKPMFWAGGLLLLAAVLIGTVPPDLIEGWTTGDGDAAVTTVPQPAPAVAAPSVPAAPAASAAIAVDAGAAAVAAPASGVVAARAASAAMAAADARPATAASAASASAAVGGGVLRIAASADSWIEVIDAQGRTVFSRTVQAGESVPLDAAAPMRVTVGNAGATRIEFRGRAVDLTAHARGSVARLELR